MIEEQNFDVWLSCGTSFSIVLIRAIERQAWKVYTRLWQRAKICSCGGWDWWRWYSIVNSGFQSSDPIIGAATNATDYVPLLRTLIVHIVGANFNGGYQPWFKKATKGGWNLIELYSSCLLQRRILSALQSISDRPRQDQYDRCPRHAAVSLKKHPGQIHRASGKLVVFCQCGRR